MSRNANSRFALNPTNIDISRSKFDRDSNYKTSFNVGELVPFYLDEVLPGDTHQIRTNKVVRFQPMVTAPMDNVYLDTYYFFVPNRLVWEHWKEFNGENTQSAWIPTTEYSIPQIQAPAGGWNIGTIADYFGIPTGVSGISVSALPFRALALIVNEWFRDQNLQQPLNIPVDDSTVIGVNTGDYVTDTVLGGKPFIANKFHDYFTSCLPSPQKGPDVSLGIAGEFPEKLNVYGTGYTLGLTKNKSDTYGLYGAGSSIGAASQQFGATLPTQATNVQGTVTGYDLGVVTKSQVASNPLKSGLYADGSTVEFNSVTINQLRLAFQIQKLYEKDARGGTRYTELLKAHFGVTSPDSRLQRPEYLGGNRIPININQVIQMSGTDATSPQGNVTGQSLTADSHGDFIKSFTEHGYIIGLAVARYDHTYQQGVPRHFTRKTRFDYYWPVLANIGEQALKNIEIFAQGNSEDDEVFGYQEAWADYRYKPSMVTGEMRSAAPASLDPWHFADDYDSLPALSASWIQEDKSNIDRTLAVTSAVSNQLFADFYIQNETTRPMPMYSIPGLIDHH